LASVSNVRSAGQFAANASTSTTVTWKLHRAVLPLASVAVHVTVVVPTGKALPLAGLQARVAPGQLSVTLAL
jgi:hypothetical protein